MASTKIEWTDAVWNPVRGCTRVSEGCRNCYAERQAIRFAGPGRAYEGLVRSTPQGPSWTGRIQLVEEKLLEPLSWRQPRRVFVNSMSDLFHPEVPDEFIHRVFEVMEETSLWNGHTFQVLTKRPERMSHFVSLRWGNGRMPRHADRIWLGTSVEDQATANQRIPHLLNTPAAVRFLSCEPLLGPIELRQGWIHGGFPKHIASDGRAVGAKLNIHWVIAGSESGPGARPMDVDWVRALRDQCTAAGVRFFYKQRLDEHGRKVSTPQLDGVCWTEVPA